MSTTTTTCSRFTSAEKRTINAGQELTDGQVIWRKLKDGTGVWRYDFRMNRQRYKGTLGRETHGVTLSQARAECQRIRAQATLDAPVRQSSHGRLQELTFEKAAEDFLKWSEAHHIDYRHNLNRMKKHLLPVFSRQKLGAITAGDVEALRTDLLSAAGLSSATIKRIVSLLSNVFEHVRQRDPQVVNPTRGLRKLRPQPEEIEIFTDQQIALLLDPAINVELRDRAMVALARYAGLRASEVLGLEWKHVDVKTRQIRICQSVVGGKLRKTTKSGKDRYVPISDSLLPILTGLKQSSTRPQWLFPGRSNDCPMHQVQAVFRRMKDRAGLSDAPGFHALRHTFATDALQKGARIHAVQNWLGHSSLQVTERYVHLVGGHADEMAALLT